jgi:arabinogalactan oligomer/maltooligosaccharide transport system permease protein
MVIASFVPIAFTVVVAFTNWDQYHPALAEGFHFIGLANFKEIIQSLNGGEFLGVLVWTLVFAAVTTGINFFLGLFLAYLLNNPHMPERNIYRTILILPWALPGTIMILAWTGLLNTQYGAINNLLVVAHLPRIDWLGSSGPAHWAILLVNAWLGYPFMMTACLGALQSVPQDVLEAAQVDGASAWVRFWKVTFPLLRTATLPLVISTFAYNLNNFGVVYLLTTGGPVTSLTGSAGATDILPSYTYKLALDLNRYGLAAAYSFLVFFIIGGLSLINFKYSHAFEEVQR